VARPRKERSAFEERLGRLSAAYKDRLVPPLGGYVYRFTIYLPVLSEGKPVFSGRHVARLAKVFHDCFRGYSETAAEGTPPWHGSWFPPGAEQPIIDRHTLFVLYTPQIEEAKDFFRRLRWILEHDEDANQDVVLIEHVTAWLVEATPMPE